MLPSAGRLGCNVGNVDPESPAVKRIVLIVSASTWIIPATLCSAQATFGWPEVIALLTKARTQATSCVEVLKSSGGQGGSHKRAADLWYGRGGDGRGYRRADDGP